LTGYYRSLLESAVGVGWIGITIIRELRKADWSMPKISISNNGIAAVKVEVPDFSFFELTTSALVGHSQHVQGFCYGCCFALAGFMLPRLRSGRVYYE
jgi:hypothetical protein